MRKSTMGRVRRGRKKGSATGFLVTWDLDSRDEAATMRLYHCVFGQRDVKGGRVYRHEGFVTRMGVRYLGQSVLFVSPLLLSELTSFLITNHIDHEIVHATLD